MAFSTINSYTPNISRTAQNAFISTLVIATLVLKSLKLYNVYVDIASANIFHTEAVAASGRTNDTPLADAIETALITLLWIPSIFMWDVIVFGILCLLRVPSVGDEFSPLDLVRGPPSAALDVEPATPKVHLRPGSARGLWLRYVVFWPLAILYMLVVSAETPMIVITGEEVNWATAGTVINRWDAVRDFFLTESPPFFITLAVQLVVFALLFFLLALGIPAFAFRSLIVLLWAPYRSSSHLYTTVGMYDAFGDEVGQYGAVLATPTTKDVDDFKFPPTLAMPRRRRGPMAPAPAPRFRLLRSLVVLATFLAYVVTVVCFQPAEPWQTLSENPLMHLLNDVLHRRGASKFWVDGKMRFDSLTTDPQLVKLLQNPVSKLLGGTLMSREELEETLNRPVVDPVEALKQSTAKQPPSTSSSSNTDKKIKNIVLVFLESTRREMAPFDYTSYFAQHKLTKEALASHSVTPFFDALKPKMFSTPDGTSQSGYTIKSLFSTWCGKNSLPVDFTVEYKYMAKFVETCLPNLLQKEGFATSYWQGAVRSFDHQADVLKGFAWNKTVSYEDVQNGAIGPDGPSLPWVNYFGIEDYPLMPAMMDWIDTQRSTSTPFFLSYLTSTSHHPYDVPTTWPKKTYIDRPGFEQVNNYLNTINYIDSFLSDWIGREFSPSKRPGLLEETAFVFIGDHGVALREHGTVVNTGLNKYETAFEVPMLVYTENEPWKRIIAGKEAKGKRTSIDIAPTILDLLQHPRDLGFDILPNNPSPSQSQPPLSDSDSQSPKRIRYGEYLGDSLFRSVPTTRPVFGASNPGGSYIRVLQRHRKLSRPKGSSCRFYDLEKDPHELQPVLMKDGGERGKDLGVGKRDEERGDEEWMVLARTAIEVWEKELFGVYGDVED
ncbi:hypothetical protein HK102_003654 [Quaeritorhiza haematococci]|nr:hypothetical protein HK102_003654 [Quaeritorhiza haematococci]